MTNVQDVAKRPTTRRCRCCRRPTTIASALGDQSPDIVALSRAGPLIHAGARLHFMAAAGLASRSEPRDSLRIASGQSSGLPQSSAGGRSTMCARRPFRAHPSAPPARASRTPPSARPAARRRSPSTRSGGAPPRPRSSSSSARPWRRRRLRPAELGAQRPRALVPRGDLNTSPPAEGGGAGEWAAPVGALGRPCASGTRRAAGAGDHAGWPCQLIVNLLML